MKLLSIVLFASAALVAVADGDAGFAETGFVAKIQENELVSEAAKPHLRRFLAGSGTGPTPTPATPAPVTPAPVTPAPATPSPAPQTPAPQTPAPQTPAPQTPAPQTPAPQTPAPETPAPTTATPTPTPTSTPATGSGSGTKTPAPVTTAPASTPTATPSTDVETTVAPNTGKILDDSSSSSASGTLSTKTPTPTSSEAKTETESKMGTGTIAGIVGGIIGGIVVLAFVTMALIRRKRDNDNDDPLSPFELSMDKGYGGAQAYGGNAPGFAGNNGARGNAPVQTQELATDTPPAGAVAAGVAYSQFYDVTTSPGSVNNQQPRRNSYGNRDEAAVVTDNNANLWMSAMDVKENDSYLSAKESHDNDSLNSGRNSYDVENADDQSSQISGSSDLNTAKDFPDYEDESARGSYEL